MLRRILWSEELNEEPVLRKILFKTKCEITEKCCKVIINSGSSDNLAFEELVNKLQLQRLRQPKHYHVAWI